MKCPIEPNIFCIQECVSEEDEPGYCLSGRCTCKTCSPDAKDFGGASALKVTLPPLLVAAILSIAAILWHWRLVKERRLIYKDQREYKGLALYWCGVMYFIGGVKIIDSDDIEDRTILLWKFLGFHTAILVNWKNMIRKKNTSCNNMRDTQEIIDRVIRTPPRS